MLSNGDYGNLIGSGVDAGMLALVESVYGILFEAGTPAKPTLLNPIEPFPYEDAANALGIDISDCMADGKVSNTLVMRKLFDNEIFRKIDIAVNNIMNRAAELGGLGSVEEDGVLRYAYPSIQKSAEVRNILENLKSGMKMALIRAISAKKDPTSALENMVDANRAERTARHIAEGPLRGIVTGLTSPSGKIRMGYSSHSYFDSYPYSEQGENELSKKTDISILMTNEDGTIWYHDGVVNRYKLHAPSGQGLEPGLVLSISAPRGILTNIMVSPFSLARTKNESVKLMYHDLLNFLMSDSIETIGSLVVETEYDDDSLDSVLPGVHDEGEFLSMMIEKLDWGDLVRFIKGKPSIARYVFFGASLRDTYRILRFFIDTSAKGLLDADTLSELIDQLNSFPDADVASGYGYNDAISRYMREVISSFGPELMSAANRYHIFDFAEEVSMILGSDPNGFIKAVTGTLGHCTKLSNPYMAEETVRTGTEGDEESAITPELYRHAMESKEVQIRMATVKPDECLDVLSRLSVSGNRYIPLHKEAVDIILSDGGERYSQGSYNIVNFYYDIVYAFFHVGFHEGRSLDTETRLRLFDDIKRDLTPSVQNAAYDYMLQHNPGTNSIQKFVVISNTVPGFQLSDRLALPIMRGEVPQGTTSSNQVSPRNLIRVARKMISEDSILTLYQSVFLPNCLNKSILREVNASTDIGKRIIRLFDGIASGEYGGDASMLKYMMLNDDLLARNGIDNYERIILFANTYVAPCWKSLSASSDDAKENARMQYQIAGEIKTYMRLFEADETSATKIFLDRKTGIFRCTSSVLKEIPGSNGAKPTKKMVQEDDTKMRAIIALALREISGSITRETSKAFIALVGTCVAGRNLISMMPDASLPDLFALDEMYRTWTDGESTVPVISQDEIDNLVLTAPEKALGIIGYIDKNTATNICQKCFTPEIVKSMSATTKGLELLLRLSSISEWKLFTKQFVKANDIRISTLLDSLPPDVSAPIRKQLDQIQGGGGGVEFGSVGGIEQSAELGSRVEYHEANGLRWMSEYVRTPGAKAQSPDKRAGLYTREQAQEMAAHLGKEGWRMPTVAELEHLGNNPEIISKKQLGFSPTGRADASGKVVSGSEYTCYAWCMGEDGVQGYSVMHNMIDTDDFDIDPYTDMLAIKLVR